MGDSDDDIPDFNLRLKFNSATDRFDFLADIDSVFDIAWYTLARMISDNPALENRQREESERVICVNSVVTN
jgi:hypothetical protein